MKSSCTFANSKVGSSWVTIKNVMCKLQHVQMTTTFPKCSIIIDLHDFGEKWSHELSGAMAIDSIVNIPSQ